MSKLGVNEMDERTLWFASGWLVGQDEGEEVRLDFQFKFTASADADIAWGEIPDLARNDTPHPDNYCVETVEFRRVGLVYVTERTDQ